MARKSLGEHLVQAKKISLEQLAKAKFEEKGAGINLATAIIRLGFMNERDVTEALAECHQLQVIDLDSYEIESSVIDLVPRNICKKHKVIPVSQTLGTLVVACSQPENMMIKDDLTFVTRSKVEFVIASESAIDNAIAKYYDSQSMGTTISELENADTEAKTLSDNYIDGSSTENAEPIIRFVNLVLAEAVKLGSSDIHVEPYEKRFRIRFRIDGKLIERLQPPSGTAGAITNRIKILSGMDIAEKRRPQDGRLKIRTAAQREFEFRVSTTPTIFGEKVVLRLLDKSGLNKPMSELGFEPDDMQKLSAAIQRPLGMVLVTGPTGSGKSTTVYSALAELNKPDVNICTAEDPVEMNLEGINHVQVNAGISLTFSSLLRSFLRQDPDIIFVGEIRDLETAEIAFKAASTGHLVISTLHTNDAASTLVRLQEIGIAPYLVASTVTLIVAQRLVGRICMSCRTPIKVNKKVLMDLGIPEGDMASYKIFDGEGCGQCNGTGIRGRIAVHELMPISPIVKESILRGAGSDELREIASGEGMRSLRNNALLKLKEGLTTIEQVLSTTVFD